MTITSLKGRLLRIEARWFEADPALKALSDDELTAALRAVSDDPGDIALADWFEAGCTGPLPPAALDVVTRSL